MTIERFPITFEGSEIITPGVRHFRFSTGNKTPFNFVPGQFITIHFEAEGKRYIRSYSIATIPDGDSEYHCEVLEFAAAFVPKGPASELLFHLEPGQTLEATGPFGRLILKDEQPKRYVLIATGTGVTPYRSMLPELERRLSQSDSEVTLLLGVQKREDLLYGADFIRMAAQYPQFKFRAQYSRETELAEPEPWEYQGYVQTALPSLELDPEHDVIYLCGNPAMIDDAFAQLKELGFTPQSIRREKYISSPGR